MQYDHNNIAEGGGTNLCDYKCAEKMTDWSILRPTCRAFEDHQISGPLLADPQFFPLYIEAMREVVAVGTEDSFVAELVAHMTAITEFVEDDFFHDPNAPYVAQFPGVVEPWDTYPGFYPYLSLMSDRWEKISEQLAAYDADVVVRPVESIGRSEVCASGSVSLCEMCSTEDIAAGCYR